MIRLNFIKLFIILAYVVCWFSISTTFDDFFIFKKKTLGLSEIINFMRHTLIYVSLVLSLILIFFKNTKNILKKNLVLVFFSLYFISQIPGLFLTPNLNENISFIVSSITTICVIILINEFFSPKEKNLLVFISLTILVSIFTLSFTNLVQEYVEGKNHLYGYFIENTDIFFNKDSPRSSGLSRSCLIIILIVYIIESILDNKTKIILIIFKIFLLTAILLYQSRTIIFLTFLTHIFIFIHDYRNSFKDLIKFLSYYLLLPLLVSFLLMDYISQVKYETKINEVISKYESIEKAKEKKIVIEKNFPLRKFDTFSSGRFDDWKSIILNFDINNIYFGYGSQGDRYLINQTASNGIIYAAVCSGVIGLFFYLLFSIIISFKILRNIFKFDRIKKVNFYASLIILVILMRSILETSYAVFSIDLIILLTFFVILNKNEIKNII